MSRFFLNYINKINDFMITELYNKVICKMACGKIFLEDVLYEIRKQQSC